MIRQVAADALLAVAVLIVAASALGLLFMPDAFAKLHYVTPAAIVAPVFVAVGILVKEGLDENSGETFLALFFMVIAGPYLSHATIRAIRVRQRGDWRMRPADADKGNKTGKAKEKTR